MKYILLFLFAMLTQVAYGQDINSFPYFTGFEGVEGTLNENFPAGWTSEDLNTVDFGNQGWQIIKNSSNSINARTDSTAVHMYSHGSEDNDDWLFSPSIEMVQGETYTLEFWYKVNLFPGTSENLEVFAATENSAEAMTLTSPLWSETGIVAESYQQAVVTFVAPEDGVYYFSFHYFSPSFQFILMLDDVTIDSDISSSLTEEFDAGIYSFSSIDNEIFLRISEPLAGTSLIRISDSLGRVIHSESLPKGSQEWSWQDAGLVSGSYFLQVISEVGNPTFTQQFLIK